MGFLYGIIIFPNTFVDLPKMECRVAATFDWEWGPSTLQHLGKAQALRVKLYVYIYVKRFNILRDMIYFNTYRDISRIYRYNLYRDNIYIDNIYR